MIYVFLDSWDSGHKETNNNFAFQCYFQALIEGFVQQELILSVFLQI